MYQAITAAAYSYTRVGGGYSEPTVHGDEDTVFHMMEPKGEDWEIVRHDVMENSVLITTARRGDVPVDPADRPPLFEFAKELAWNELKRLNQNVEEFLRKHLDTKEEQEKTEKQLLQEEK